MTSVKVTMLYDNRCGKCQLQEGWGFSAFIETGESKILFDKGGNPIAFFSNAKKMNFPYSQITHLLFSLRHWDHIAGFAEIVKKVSKDTALYVPKAFPWFLLRKSSSHLKKGTVVRSFEEITPNVFSLVLRCRFWLYEQALVLRIPQGLGIITGCAHTGIIEILKAAQQHLQETIYFVLGGFHLLFAPAEKSMDIVRQFQIA